MMNKAFRFGWLEQEVAEISSVACFVGALLMIPFSFRNSMLLLADPWVSRCRKISFLSFLHHPYSIK